MGTRETEILKWRQNWENNENRKKLSYTERKGRWGKDPHLTIKNLDYLKSLLSEDMSNSNGCTASKLSMSICTIKEKTE